MKSAKTILILIILVLIVIIFFAVTGLDVNNPAAAMERIIAWTVRVNRQANTILREFFYSVRTWILDLFQ